ncbi:phosphatidylserine decarboxylase-domain-containing protein [Chaetomium strumarium]|uniref:Phosphatidylserine decarboxylase-domain-containing protein n=1 Tax=Chaetomium strumarium TaxID=1170767 RepID=A0AAJ0GS67_9PEZI|nr:phosphatidylserine decarboxylase-domain-containing protein [Chaetomium strumarium]
MPHPINGPGNNKVVVYPANSRFDAAFTIDANDRSNPSANQIDINTLLNSSQYASSFAGGIWSHSFLSTYNYHRLYAPVSGTVVEARVIANLKGGTFKKRCYIGKLPKNKGMHIEAVDGAGYQFLQTCSLFVIDTSIQASEQRVLPEKISSVKSQHIRLRIHSSLFFGGNPLAYFQFGGSDIIVVFQKKAGLGPESFFPYPDPDTAPDHPSKQWSRYGQQLAQAAPQ